MNYYGIKMTEEQKRLARWLFCEYLQTHNETVRRLGIGREELMIQVDYFVSSWNHNTTFLVKEFNAWLVAGYLGDANNNVNTKETTVSSIDSDFQEEYNNVPSPEDDESSSLLALLQNLKHEPERPSVLRRNNLTWFEFFKKFTEITLNYKNISSNLNASKEEMKELGEFLNIQLANALREEYPSLRQGMKRKFYLSQQSVNMGYRSRKQTLESIIVRIKDHSRHNKNGNSPIGLDLLLSQMGGKNTERCDYLLSVIEEAIEDGVLYEQETKRGARGINYYKK